MFAKKTIKDVDVRGQARARARRLQRPARRRRRSPTTRASARRCPRSATWSTTARKVILVSHLGRPKGEPDPQFSLQPGAPRAAAPARPQRRASSTTIVGPEADEAVERMVDGEILMLENVRFDPGEKANDPEFAEAARRARRHLRQRRVRRGAPRARLDRGRRALPAGVRRPAARARGRDAHRHARRPGAPVRRDPRRLARSPTSSASSTGCSTASTRSSSAAAWLHVPRRQGRRGRQVDRRGRTGSSPPRRCSRRPPSKGVDLLLPVDFVVADAIAEDAETRIVGREEIPGDMMGLDIGPTHDRAVQGRDRATRRRSSGTARWASSR